VYSNKIASLFVDGRWINLSLNDQFRYISGIGNVTKIVFYSPKNSLNNIEVTWVENTDYCDNNYELVEFYCSNNFMESDLFHCPGGCSLGVCQGILPLEIESCNDFSNLLKNPRSFEYHGEYRLDFNESYTGRIWDEGKQITYSSDYISWSSFGQDKYNSIAINTYQFPDDYDTNKWLHSQMNWDLCRGEHFYKDGKKNTVYYCNSDLLWSDRARHGNAVTVLWANENKVFLGYTYSADYSFFDEELSRKRERKDLNDFVDKLRGYSNDAYVNIHIDWPLRQIIEMFVVSCGSTISDELCSPLWRCKTEPIICPPHGYQIRTCVDYSCGLKERTTDVLCSPGICAGCLVSSMV
jgi:hypothetical protein